MKAAHAIQMNSETSTHEIRFTKYFTWPMLWIPYIDLGKPPGTVKDSLATLRSPKCEASV